MKPVTLLLISLLSFLSGCLTRDDTHPDMPLLPHIDNARIRIDSIPNTTVHSFIFSADKTKIYAIVLTASTGVFATHTLVEYDQLGHQLRQLPLGEMSIQQTELALLQPGSLLWQFANVFYIIDLQQFKVIDEVHTYWAGNYPDAQQAKDRAKVANESQAWFHQKQKEIGERYGIQKTDSVTFAVLEGNKANADKYREAIRAAREQQTQFESDRHEHYYEEYAQERIRSGKLFFGYRSPGGHAEYLFTKFQDGSTAAFTLTKGLAQKTEVRFLQNDVNTKVTLNRTNARFNFAEGQSVSDKTSALRTTEKIVTKRSSLLSGAVAEDYLFYYELKLSNETARFKWLLPLKLSNDFYLQSANGSAFILKKDTLYWFHL
ncbi:hypothetical protein GO755_23810 [Spirosoma sp. HMF4905]|uniref:Uncharacterized protein n=1 Tax=Spirosoma arboris TaxID=2682092 RepID=A0A7K1SH94_9BACT|nr:hypothetical protein [Spirosoma arboris]MVM33088.1 hypothetical protein [Spirosoma arboris]